MTTPARIAHHTAGRIRIEIPGRRGDGAFFSALAGQLAQSGQVARVRGNPAAASVVVEYSGPLDALLAQFERCALQLSAAAPAPAAAPLAAGWKPNPMAMAGAAFGIVALVQTVRGEIMLPALSAFWYAASALRLARLPENGRGAGQAATQANITLP